MENKGKNYDIKMGKTVLEEIQKDGVVKINFGIPDDPEEWFSNMPLDFRKAFESDIRPDLSFHDPKRIRLIGYLFLEVQEKGIDFMLKEKDKEKEIYERLKMKEIAEKHQEWVDSLTEKVLMEGEIVYSLDWYTGTMPDGEGSDRVYKFNGKYWWDDGYWGMTGPHDDILSSFPEPHIPVTDSTTGIWCEEWKAEEIIQYLSYDCLESEITISINGRIFTISPDGTITDED
jgi:hypothetical protein